ncbi:MAG: CPBP family intramembrane metalloprotease [Chloroflexi bacterium]|nr:CPBP family intramembrane metalloprotease [Chloroflexota bacterium]MCL5274532.1 CPBP family intramembrane metalloprotease [Chloroflexota bacterium]
MDNALLTLLLVSPFLLAILVANLAERNPKWRVFHYIYLFCLNGVAIVFGLSFLAVGVLSTQGDVPGMPALLKSVNWVGAGLWLLAGGTIALVVLLPPVRQLVGRPFGLDPNSVVHTTALSMTATAIASNLFQMSFASYLLTPEGLKQAQQSGGATYMDIFVSPLLILLLAALLGVGWLTRRTWPEIVERLGLTTPTVPQLILAVIVAVALLGLSFGTDMLWSRIDPAGQKQVGGVSSALLGNFTGLSGAFAIGITAAIGEELFFRGAYQHRMGIVMTAILFASFHTQYFISIATLLIFIIGLVLGVLRKRTTLAVCILVHFLYNFASVLLGS